MQYRHKSGFTIVELLIVIVVIGILAAITIISFNGIQNRARTAAVQNDLESSAKSLELYKFTNIATTGGEYYPKDLATANLKASNGTVFQYIVNDDTSPTAYCLSATNSGITKSIVKGISSAVQGTCYMNYAPNPSAEGSTNLIVSAGTPVITPSTTSMSGWPISGTQSYKVAATTNGTTRVRTINNTIPAINGRAVTVSAYIYNASIGPRIFDISFQPRTSTGAVGLIGTVATYTIPSGQSAYVSYTLPDTADLSTFVGLEPMFSRPTSSGTTAANASDVFYIDNIMLSYSNTPLSYADGGTPNWIWNGSVNDTSMGPI